MLLVHFTHTKVMFLGPLILVWNKTKNVDVKELKAIKGTSFVSKYRTVEGSVFESAQVLMAAITDLRVICPI